MNQNYPPLQASHDAERCTIPAAIHPVPAIAREADIPHVRTMPVSVFHIHSAPSLLTRVKRFRVEDAQLAWGEVSPSGW